MKTLAKVKSGELAVCEHCSNYHLIFNNIFLELNKNEFKRLKIFILNLDVEYWENKYDAPNLKRKIPIPSRDNSLVLMFNRQEIAELKQLFSKQSNIYNTLIDVGDIDYNYYDN